MSTYNKTNNDVKKFNLNLKKKYFQKLFKTLYIYRYILNTNLLNILYKLRKMLVLVGLMGAGKSSIGNKLSDFLNVGFLDADSEIEKAAGMTIVEIFEKFGEKYFRAGEKKVVSRLMLQKPQVLSSGGGAFISDDLRELIKKHGFSIWLKADYETLWPRVSGKKNRPLLNQLEPEKVLKSLIRERNPIYSEADITIESKPKVSHSKMVEKIVIELKKNQMFV